MGTIQIIAVIILAILMLSFVCILLYYDYEPKIVKQCRDGKFYLILFYNKSNGQRVHKLLYTNDKNAKNFCP